MARKKTDKPAREFALMQPNGRVRYTKIDVVLILALTLIYAAVAFFNLGNMTGPQTAFSATGGDKVIIALDSAQHIETLMFFTGVRTGHETPKYSIAYSLDGRQYSSLTEKENAVFHWAKIPVNQEAKYIRISLANYTEMTEIDEVGLFGPDDVQLKIQSVKDMNGQDIPQLYDEQDQVPADVSFKNGTYFDEIYHARTAYEHLNGIYPYETTHPPLGKALIALGISIFGMVPFGWRFMGTLCGVLMVPMMYLFGKQMFKKSIFGFIPAFLMAFDFMHFTQTRIATIDSYAVFFIIIMYYFMLRFFQTNYNCQNLKTCLKPLFWSGLFFGIGAASKWIDIYAGIGLAVLFFTSIILRWKEYRLANEPDHEKNQEAQMVRERFKKNTLHLTLWAVVFFAVIPICVYVLSYLPMAFIKTYNYTLENVWANQVSMLSYHGKLVATHPYSSWWYEWPIMRVPIWYFSGSENGMSSSISAFGNPAVWWTGMAATVCVLGIAAKRALANSLKPRDHKIKQEHMILFLMVAYMSQYVPWMPISRIVFIYHYFASIPFVILIITYVLYVIYNKLPEGKKKGFYIGVGIYLLSNLVLFGMFYGPISGFPTDRGYVDAWLKWVSSWVLRS